MSSKHTPEPWSIKSFESGSFYIVAGTDPDHLDSMVVACLSVNEAQKHQAEELRANARLIANAPKMYEALKSIIKHQYVVSPGMPSATKLMAVIALSEIDNPKD